MKNDLMKQLLVVGIAIVLVSIIFMPIVTSYSTRLEKQVEIVKEEDDGYSVLTNVDRYRIPNDITENQLGYHLPKMNPYSLDYRRQYIDQLKDRTLKDFSRENAYVREPIWTGSRNGYTPHDPIIIDSDDDFTSENGVTGGNGTVNDPYIIEGWEIDTTEFYAISISQTTSYFIIRNCLLKNAEFGIYLYKIAVGTVTDTICNTKFNGIRTYSSFNVSISDSTISAEIALFIEKSVNVSAYNCSITSTSEYGDGVRLDRSTSCILSNISATGGYYGVYVKKCSSSNVIKDCHIFSNYVAGIDIYESSSLILRNNILHDNTNNLYVYGYEMDEYIHDIDASNTVDGKPVYYLINESDLVFDGSDDIGYLGLVNCDNILVKNVTMNNLGQGVLLAGSQNSMIASSTFNNDFHGILLFKSSNNTVSGCNFINTSIAIPLQNSPYNVFRDNSISGNSRFGVLGQKLEDFYQDIDKSNTLNDKPIYYLVEEKNQVITGSNVGFLALVNCKNIIVYGLQISNSIQGILLAKTNAIIRRCEFSYNAFGIYVFNRSLLRICDSKIYYNDFGFIFEYASGVGVVRCRVSGNSVGFNLFYSHDNIVRDCNINNQWINGFQVKNSCNNVFCGNKISDNRGGFSIHDDCWGNEISSNSIHNGYSGIVIMGPDQPVGSHNNTVHNNNIYNMDFFGIGLVKAHDNNIHHNSIHDTSIGIIVSNCQRCEFHRNNIYDNDKGMQVGYCTVDAANNWWGSDDGPSGEGPGSGDYIEVVEGDVSFDPWLKKPAITKPFVFLCILACIRVRLRSLIGSNTED